MICFAGSPCVIAPLLDVLWIRVDDSFQMYAKKGRVHFARFKEPRPLEQSFENL